MVWLIYIIAACAFFFMHTSIFPSFKDQQIDIDKMMESMPEGFKEAFGLDDYNMSIFENYIAAEEFSIIWPLLLIILSISLAGAAIASEIEKGTIEILISQPLSRTGLYISRYLSGLILIIGFVVITLLCLIGMAKIFDINPQYSHYFTIGLSGLLFGWAVYSIAFFLSAIFSDRGKVYFISVALIVVMYAINIVSSLKDSLKDLKYVSFFSYFNANDLLIRNQIDKVGIVVFISVIIVFSILGLFFFNNRDIAT
jgi:ABC-2 type transport system permease protein